MKKRPFCFLFLFLFACALSATDASAKSVLLYDNWGGTYHDAEKSPTNTEDDLMCWAASASNVLAWSGWGYPAAASFSGEDDIFGYFQSHWTDAGGSVYYGLDWWFDGVNESQGDPWQGAGWSQVDVPGGGFWTGYSLSNYLLYSSNEPYALSNIAYLISYGYGTSLGLTNGAGGHAITAWGYETDDAGMFVGLWVTDSDDSKGQEHPEDVLAYYDIAYSGESWFLQDFYGYNNWYITDVFGLAAIPDSIGQGLNGADQNPQGSPVPEPAGILLLGAGAIGLAGVRRKSNT
jgi:hypothetical protein